MDEAKKYLEETIKIDPENLNIIKKIPISNISTGKLKKLLKTLIT